MLKDFIIQHKKKSHTHIHTHLLTWPLISSGKSLDIWEAVNFMMPFQNSDFARQFKCYNWRQIQPVVFLEVTGSIHSFLRKCSPNAILQITIVCLPVVLSDKKNRVKQCLVQFPTDYTRAFSQDHASFMKYASCFITQNTNKTCSKVHI